MSVVRVYFDGACHNNGTGLSPLGMGVVAKDSSAKVIIGFSETTTKLGTSNQAEWGAACMALEWIKDRSYEHPDETYRLYGDSQLIINQLNGVWGVKSAGLGVIMR